VLNRSNFTADEETTPEGTFYTTNPFDAGIITNADQIVVVTDDGQVFFHQDALSDGAVNATTIYAGNYSGFLT